MWTYFVRYGSDGPVRIGKSADLFKRISQHDSACYEELIFLGAFECDCEREMFARFRHLRIKNSFYRPAEDLINFILANAKRVDWKKCSRAEVKMQPGPLVIDPRERYSKLMLSNCRHVFEVSGDRDLTEAFGQTFYEYWLDQIDGFCSFADVCCDECDSEGSGLCVDEACDCHDEAESCDCDSCCLDEAAFSLAHAAKEFGVDLLGMTKSSILLFVSEDIEVALASGGKFARCIERAVEALDFCDIADLGAVLPRENSVRWISSLDFQYLRALRASVVRSSQ